MRKRKRRRKRKNKTNLEKTKNGSMITSNNTLFLLSGATPSWISFKKIVLISKIVKKISSNTQKYFNNSQA